MTVHVPSFPAAPAPVPENASFLVRVDLLSGWASASGELDREDAHHVLDALDPLAATPHAHWTLDVRPVTFCDAEGLRVLVLAHRLARGHGRTLSVLPSPCVHRLLLLVGLDRLLDTPPAPDTVRTGVAERRRSRRTLAAVRDLRRVPPAPGAAASSSG